ncbi:MAG TPA: hypothetical protein DEA85_07910 [Firmicutes bacterium]|nr:hypothetical protein [Bacillota bacterium]
MPIRSAIADLSDLPRTTLAIVVADLFGLEPQQRRIKAAAMIFISLLNLNKIKKAGLYFSGLF